MNIAKSTIETLQGLGYLLTFETKSGNECDYTHADTMGVAGLKLCTGELQYIGKRIKATKKEMSLDYIMNKLNTDIIYKNFSSEFNKAIKHFGLSAYPTTYGIGVTCLFVSSEKTNEIKADIQKALDKIGIAYTTEYSDAGWVYRYKISKNEKNIKILSDYKCK